MEDTRGTTAAAELPPPPSPDGCAICLEDYYGQDGESISATLCGHVFHTSCFQRYMESCGCGTAGIASVGSSIVYIPLKCPVCKQPVQRLTRLYCTLAAPPLDDTANIHPSSDNDSISSSHSETKLSVGKRAREHEDSRDRNQAKRLKKLFRKSQREVWQWQGKYREAVQDHATALAAERQQTAQATSLALLMQLQFQHTLATHHQQLERALAASIQREEDLRSAQLELRKNPPPGQEQMSQSQEAHAVRSSSLQVSPVSPLVSPLLTTTSPLLGAPTGATTTNQSSMASLVIPGALSAALFRIRDGKERNAVTQPLVDGAAAASLVSSLALPPVSLLDGGLTQDYLTLLSELVTALSASPAAGPPLTHPRL